MTLSNNIESLVRRFGECTLGGEAVRIILKPEFGLIINEEHRTIQVLPRQGREERADFYWYRGGVELVGRLYGIQPFEDPGLQFRGNDILIRKQGVFNYYVNRSQIDHYEVLRKPLEIVVELR